MIKNIIFDFGDIFINLDKPAVFEKMKLFGFSEYTPELDRLAKDYEMGLCSSEAFVSKINTIFPKAEPTAIIDAWNTIIKDFPKKRLQFIEKLHKEDTYRLFLLSNTNALHITYVQETMGMDRYERFKNSFEQFYLSHEIHMRKPNTNIFEYVLKENSLNASETLFIDDSEENIHGAEKLGIQCWHLQVGKDDIIDLHRRL